MATSLTYHAKLAGYHIGRHVTLGATPFFMATVASLWGGTAVFDAINNDLDPTGTTLQQQTVEQLQTQKASLLTQIAAYQNLQRQNYTLKTDKATLQTAKTSLQESTMRFFADLVGNGSMQDGLDVGEADVKAILEELKSGARDFDWQQHVNNSIPDMIEYGIDYANNLDEVRTLHRHEGTEPLTQRFSIAKDIIKEAKQRDEMNFMLSLIAVLATSALGGTQCLYGSGSWR